jgi:hypothetical protein
VNNLTFDNTGCRTIEKERFSSKAVSMMKASSRNKECPQSYKVLSTEKKAINYK